MRNRAPRKKLIEAGNIARGILEERKIILPKEKSAVDRIMNTPGAPMLPGLPGQEYIPYPWTINVAKRIVYDLGRAWQADLKNDDSRKSKGVEFFKFVLEGLNRPRSKIGELMEKSVKERTYNQKFLSQKEVTNALRRYMIDSFAISVIVKSHEDVADYLIWFLDWSDKLLKLWPENIRFIDAKTNNSKLQTTDNTAR